MLGRVERGGSFGGSLGLDFLLVSTFALGFGKAVSFFTPLM